ncbi:MAG: energy transducer TonB [Bacteroidota bacterium]
MRSLTIALLLVFSTSNAFTQAKESLIGSWEITSAEDPLSNELESTKPYIPGTRLHFTEDYLIIENSRTVQTFPVQYGEMISFSEYTFDLINNESQKITLISTNQRTKKILRYYLEPTDPLSAERLSQALDIPTGQSAYGFSYEGFYHRFDSEDSLYHYFRFYPDERLVQYKSSYGPEELVYFINARAAGGTKPLEILDTPTPAVVRHLAPKLILEESSYVLYSDLIFSINTDGIPEVLHKTFSVGQEDQPLSTDTYALEFYPTSELSYNVDIPRAQQRMPLNFSPISRAPRSISTGPEVFKIAPEMPRFPGCEAEEELKDRKRCAQQELLKYIYKNVRYPASAHKLGVEGTVVVSFTVYSDGTIGDISLPRDIGGGCGEEGLQVVGQMHYQNITWIPAKDGQGKPVNCRFNMPIKFNLE